MIEVSTFLGLVCPENGFYCVLGLNPTGRFPKQNLVRTLDDVESVSAGFCLAEKRNAYFALASFKTSLTRAADNAARMKTFFLDIDVGEEKHYKTKQDALAAIQFFRQDMKLPLPFIVDSGGGYHVYWPLQESITIEEWRHVAKAFKRTCMRSALVIDPAVPADAARVLRVPGTKNYNYETQPTVSVIQLGVASTLQEFKTCVNFETENIVLAPPRFMVADDPVTKALVFDKNVKHVFSRIAKLSLTDKGCGQIKKALLESETTIEPIWRAALSIATFCSDAETAIHKLSQNHPDYTPEGTIEKSLQIKGPYTCERFAQDDPLTCDSCPLKGTIKSPIVLGKALKEAVATTSADGKATIPTPPFPFARGENGGIYYKTKEKDENGVEQEKFELVLKQDFYPIQRVKDEEEGESIWFKLETPQDGVLDIVIPLTTLVSRDKFRELLAKNGLTLIAKGRLELLGLYVDRCLQELQMKGRAHRSRTQFGWTEGDHSFVIGDREYIKGGKFLFSPPSASTVTLAKAMRPTGEVDDWKRMAAFYARPGLELYQYVIMSAFGAPLLRFLGPEVKGVYSTLCGASGVGKTTAMKVAASVWGRPDSMLMTAEDTPAARINRLGVYNALPYFLDEITNIQSSDLSNMIYAMSHGQGRNRLNATTNIERINTISWCTMSFMTSNSSVEDKLKEQKLFPEAEMLRGLNFDSPALSSIDKNVTDEIFSKLNLSYGNAGALLVPYMLDHLEEIIELMNKVQYKFDNRVKFTQRHRFWSAACATAITGGIIGRELGLINYDMEAFTTWLADSMKLQMRVLNTETDSVSNIIGVLGNYMAENTHNMITYNSTTDGRSALAKKVELRGSLLIRIDIEENTVHLVAKKFREYCSKQQVNWNQLLEALQKQVHAKIETKMRRLGAGTTLSSMPPVYALSITSKELFESSEIQYISAQGA